MSILAKRRNLWCIPISWNRIIRRSYERVTCPSSWSYWLTLTFSCLGPNDINTVHDLACSHCIQNFSTWSNKSPKNKEYSPRTFCWHAHSQNWPYHAAAQKYRRKFALLDTNHDRVYACMLCIVNAMSIRNFVNIYRIFFEWMPMSWTSIFTFQHWHWDYGAATSA